MSEDWQKQPGEVHDSKGYPIYPGDLLRFDNCTGKRRKKYYCYHTAVFVNGYLEIVPTEHLQPDLVAQGGRCALDEGLAGRGLILAGHGPDGLISFEDRPRRKP